jgi:predicted dehydrogenase
MNLRVGLVGAGHICPFHVQALRRIPGIEIAGIYDCDSRRAMELVQKFQAGQVYTSYSQLLEAVHVVHVLTPPDSHTALTLQALESGCDVFVEKPLAATMEDCQRIEQRADALAEELDGIRR